MTCCHGFIDVEQEFEIIDTAESNLRVLESAKCEIMRPRSGFIVKRSAARCIITLFDRGILQPQERFNHASPRRLWSREDELRAVDRAAAIRSGQVDDRGITNGGYE